MNKKNLIMSAAKEAMLTVKDENLAVEAFLCVIADSLKAGKDIVLPDFGRFTVVDCPERKVRHPQTGETMTIPPMKRVRFKPFGNITNYSVKHGL